MEKYSRGWRGAPAKGVDRLFPVRGFKSLFLRFFKKDKRYFEDEADFWFYCLDREKAFGHAVNLLQWIRNFFEVKIQIIRYVLWAPFERQIRRVFFYFTAQLLRLCGAVGVHSDGGYFRRRKRGWEYGWTYYWITAYWESYAVITGKSGRSQTLEKRNKNFLKKCLTVFQMSDIINELSETDSTDPW